MMENKFSFNYPDENGNLTERRAYNSTISETSGCIDAFYQHNDEIRTFKLTKMSSVIDMDTGKLIENPWEYFGLIISIPDRIDAAVIHILPAIKSLKFFALTTRGFAKRERGRIAKLIYTTCRVEDFVDEEINEWLKSLWVGNIYEWREGSVDEYQRLLNAIPISQRQKCHEVALLIASGSGRKILHQKLRERIDMEFSLHPVVQEPYVNFDD